MPPGSAPAEARSYTSVGEARPHPRLDRLDRRAGTRRDRSLGRAHGRRPRRPERLVTPARAGRRDRGGPDRARRPGRRRGGLGVGLGGHRPGRRGGDPRADRADRPRRRPQRDRRIGRPRADDRDAQRGDRPGPRQQGEPRRRRRPRHGAGGGVRRPHPPGRLRALRPAPADPLRAARRRRAARPDRLGRAVPGPHRPRRHHPAGGARPPDLGDGRQDHDRLGDADEQGPRADRGPSPLRRPLRAHRRRRPPAVADPLADPPGRRRHARPPRPPGHAGADLLRAARSRSHRPAGGAARSRRRRRAHVRGARPRHVSLPAPRPRGRRGGGDRALRPQRRQRGGRAGRSSRAPCRSRGSARSSRQCWRRWTPPRRPTSRTSSHATPRRAGGPRARSAGSGWRRELGPRHRRLRAARDPPRGGPLHRGQADRHARRALLPVLPAEARLDHEGARPSTGSARSRWAAS